MYCVYLIQCGDLPYYKIGVSCDMGDRFKNLQSCNPHELTVLCTCGFGSSKAAYAAEADCHRKLFKERIRGEWFQLTDVQVRQLKHDMVVAE